MTYTELIEAIQSYTQNTFPPVYDANGAVVMSSTDQLDRIIEQAEQLSLIHI